MTTQNLWNSVKSVLRGKFIAIQAYLKYQEKHQIKNLSLHLKQLEKEEQKNPKLVEGKKFWKIKAEIIEEEMKETIAMINKTEIQFFVKINKIDKPLPDWSWKKGEESNQ